QVPDLPCKSALDSAAPRDHGIRMRAARADSRSPRLPRGVAVANAERGRAALSPPSVPSNGISTVPVDTCVTASCVAANRLIARTREVSFEANRRFIRIGSQWHSDIG